MGDCGNAPWALPGFVVIGVGCALACVAVVSLRWPLERDAPLMVYMAFLIRSGCVPYTGFFDMNCPGTHAAYVALTRVFGYGDLGLRLADLCCLGVLLGLTAALLRPLGRRVACFGGAAFGLAYLCRGPGVSLQRDFVLLLPVALGLLIAQRGRSTAVVRGALAGVCCGCAIAIKPQAAVVLPVVWGWLLCEARGWRAVGVALAVLAGSALVPCAALCWLAAKGALPAYMAIVRDYLPLYGGLSGSHETLIGGERLAYLVAGVRNLGRLGAWLGPAAVGVYVALYHSSYGAAERRLVWALVGLAAAFAVYPLPAGKFWDYHWLPLGYALSLVCGLCLCEPRGVATRGQRAFPLAAVGLMLLSWYQPVPLVPAPPEGGRPDAISRFLKANLRPGETVQPLDWTGGGVVHGMLLARAPLATRFVYTFHFYHHVSSPVIQGLRREFIASLERALPRYVIGTTVPPPWPEGPDTSREFPELRAFLARGYRVVSRENKLVIYELQPAPVSPGRGGSTKAG